MKNENDIAYMQAALEQAEIAYSMNEIPVGAVIVFNNEIISKAHNMTRIDNNPIKHAEIICIEEAAKVLMNERLLNCDLYVTKEPCAMCSGAIINARLRKVVIAAEDIKYGACGTVMSVCGSPVFNHVPEIEFGLMREQAADLIKKFFRELRDKKK